MTIQDKLKRFKIRDNEEKKDDVNSIKKSLDKETELVKRKQKEDKARKRTRGPYRKLLNVTTHLSNKVLDLTNMPWRSLQ